jgi:hypothetical protein
LIFLVWIIPQPASAQAPLNCQSIADRDARLICYDQIFPPIRPQPGTSSDESDQHRIRDSAPSASKTTLDYSWADVVGCRTIAKAPAFRFSNVPEKAHSVSLVLTQGEREFGGQEVTLPATGLVAEGEISMRGPCVPGMYRWTATIKSATGSILTVVHADRWFPQN